MLVSGRGGSACDGTGLKEGAALVYPTELSIREFDLATARLVAISLYCQVKGIDMRIIAEFISPLQGPEDKGELWAKGTDIFLQTDMGTACVHVTVDVPEDASTKDVEKACYDEVAKYDLAKVADYFPGYRCDKDWDLYETTPGDSVSESFCENRDLFRTW